MAGRPRRSHGLSSSPASNVYRDRNGNYAREFILENQAGAPGLLSHRRLTENHPIEKVGAELRNMMPWIKANKLVDKDKN